MLRRCGHRLSPLLLRELTRRHPHGDRTHARDASEVRRLTIERAGPDDLAEVVPLFCEYLLFYEAPVDLERATAFISERLAAESVFYVARVARDTVAFAHLFPAYATLAQRTIWILEDLFVAPSARGAGIATGLLVRAQAHASATGALGLTLATAKTNAIAQRAYERCGWQRDERFITYELALE